MVSTLRAVYRFLGSRRFAATLMISWTILLVMWVVPFIFYGLPAVQIERIITGEIFFRIVYVLVLVATAACITARIPALISTVRKMPSPAARPRVTGMPSVLPGDWDPDRARRTLDAAGVRQRVIGDGWMWGVRNRYSPLGTVLFHLAFFFILGAAALGLSGGARFEGKTVVAEGETFTSKGRDSYSDLLTPEAKIPRLTFTLESFEPRFHEDILLFTKLEGVVRDARGSSHRIRLGSPWIATPTTLVSVEDFGYAATAVLRRADDTTIGPSTYKLKVFPSQLEDSFDVPGAMSPYRVEVRVYGDYVDRGGKPGSASFNRSNPRLLLTVNRVLSTGAAEPLIEDRLVRLGEPLDLGSETLTITELPYYGVFRITRVTWVPLTAVGVLLLAAGAVLRLAFPRTEVLLLSTAEGVVVSVRDEVYRRAPALSARVLEAWEDL